MSSFSIIQDKLEQFIKKYYTNELIKGVILFFAIGLLYFIITLLVEHFLWLDPTPRAILFWVFVGVEVALFIRFIAFPLAKLFKLQQGISYEEASGIIGRHFPQVSDKLLNVIQLNQNQRQSELLAASIDQKSTSLEPIPFVRAINFKKNAKYLKYAAIPVIIILMISLLWDASIFSSSYERVVNYEQAYEPPAPFQFVVLNEELKAIENKNFTLQVQTVGSVLPENATVSFNNETYYLQQTNPGIFEYTFLQPAEDFEFRVSANDVSSQTYIVEVIKTPSLLDFEMFLDYPAYTGKKDELLKGTGNATVPEGTQIRWEMRTKNTDSVHLRTEDTSYVFSKQDKEFNYNKRIYRRLNYAITTSNKALRDYENLNFSLGIIKDAYPEISVSSKQDSTSLETYYFLGEVSDDYGLTKLQLVYYPMGSEEEKQQETISIGKSNFDQFVFTFPGEIPLEEGVSYEYYFEVFDNDALHNYKSSKSGFYTFRKMTQEEKETLQLEKQGENVKDLAKTLEKLKQQEKDLEQINKTQKEKEQLNWNDKKKLENFLKRQKQQEQIMKNFKKEIQEDLEKFQPENEDDPFKEQLEERLEENEERLEENEKLLEELERLQDKIDKEELSEKLEKLAKQNKNQEKNLEQLVELTKRYYVTKKAEKLAEKLFKLGEEQEQLSEAPKKENTPQKQEELNKKFEDYQKEMEELQKENQGLKEPMDIPQDKSGEQEVEQEQQKASDKLEQQNQQGASQNQKKAGQKMKQMGQQMQAGMMAGQMESINEDIDMLRQILDNLVVFSFEQEDLMEDFNEIDYGSAAFGKKLNNQNDLKQNFKHIDDSIFELSLRQPLISDDINESLTEISFNMDKSLERLAENNCRSGIASQQYTITGANELAVLLSGLLGNMQSMAMSMPGQGQGEGQGQGQGQGQGKGFQLPDIIQQQKSLSDAMEKGMQQGQGKEGESGGEGQGQGQGESGEGNQGKGEQKGENGKGEKSGKGSGDGEGDGNKGKEGEKGDGFSEDVNGELYEIYKRQQDLRNQLKNRLSKEGLDGQGGKIIKEMEGIEQQLLEKGFNQRTLERMLNLQYELLKLDKAAFEQGKESRRESRTNNKEFNNTQRLQPDDIQKYFNQEEILNREALPLQLEYKKAVQKYFEKND